MQIRAFARIRAELRSPSVRLCPTKQLAGFTALVLVSCLDALEAARIVFDSAWGTSNIAGMRLRLKNEFPTVQVMHSYEVRPRRDYRDVDLISNALPFGRLWYSEPNAIENAIDYAKFRSRSHDAVISVYDAAGNVIETHEHAGDFKEW